ncbi:MAG: surface lipoprotein assembly modifier [Ignavibacteria bacterium]|nr:surface lipoprotein assembly modifier [Ignavibacteria bacterium]
MKRIIGSLCLLVLLFAVFSVDIQAQLYLTTDVEGYYDDNIFNNYLNASDFINAFSGELGYDFETEQNNFKIYYTGFFNQYYKYTDKSTAIHKFGAVNTYLFSEYDNPLNIGINYAVRINKEDYYIYDFNQVSAYANYIHSISESNKIQLGVIGNRIDYENFSLFSHYQLKAFLRSINSFESRTSLTAAVEIDQKNYIEDYQSEGLANEVLQAKLFLQLGQGITDDLGLSAYVFLRNNLSGGNRYFNTTDYIYYEEELFNDIYSNEGVETGLTLSYLFLPNIMGKISARYEIRNYTDLPAADEEGNDLNELRKDDQFSIGASLEFGLGQILSGLYLSLNYNYIKNNSNDYYYDYNNQIYAITLGFDF